MRKALLSSVLISLLTTLGYGQILTKTLRGTVLDIDSKLPLKGVAIKVIGSEPNISTKTDSTGNFRFDNLIVGRISLQLTLVGYENKVLTDLELNSGKEKVLTINMQEAIFTTEEVVVKAIKTKDKGDAVNEMSIISTHSISLEETKRYAGSFNDPARILTNFAGVTNTQNGENDIIVRGNSPKYVQWRLEGVEITNPTHFADQNTAKGGISALNSSLLATSDFSTGAFSPEYGDALSGIYDIKLRAGNNEKFEAAASIGLLGTDFTIEGPLKKGYKGSFLVNYRYSTISLIQNLGLVKIDGVLNYQDMAFKFVLPTNKIGTFSLFGLGGLNSFLIKDIKADMITTQSNQTNTADISEDFEKDNHLANIGLNHSINITNKSYISSSLSFASNGINEDGFKTKSFKIYDNQNVYVKDSMGNKTHDNISKLNKSTYRISTTYTNKLNSKNTLQVGVKYAVFGYNYNLSWLDSNKSRFTAVDLDKNISTLRSFISLKHRLNKDITIVGGVHYMNVLLNNTYSFEPRLAVKWRLNNSNSINVGYGKHSTMESVHNYFTRIKLADGSITEPNKDLGLLKAHHFVLGYEKRFNENIRLKLETYYQDLYNLPVENSITSNYATINESTNFRYVDLVNKGTGKNYGVEFTLERFFDKNYYFLVNTSIYNSKYKALDGVERNTLYNSNYLVNILAGKEFTNLGRNKNQSLNLNTKIFVGGGQKYIPLLRDAQGKLAVDPSKNQFWDNSKAYENSLDNIYSVTISVSYKWNKPKSTHELYVNIDNITDHKGKLSEFYDQTKPNNIGYITQFGFFPNLLYRKYF